jgi:hypothetical protein
LKQAVVVEENTEVLIVEETKPDAQA